MLYAYSVTLFPISVSQEATSFYKHYHIFVFWYSNQVFAFILSQIQKPNEIDSYKVYSKEKQFTLEFGAGEMARAIKALLLSLMIWV